MIDEKARVFSDRDWWQSAGDAFDLDLRGWTDRNEASFADKASGRRFEMPGWLAERILAYESAKPKEAEGFVLVPKERYRELVAEELWNAFNCGIERDGKWMDGGRSEGEWLVRRLGLPDDGWHDAEVMKGMMAAAIDRAMLSAAGDGNG